MTGKIPKTKQLYFFLMPEETTKVLEFIGKKECIIYAPRSTGSVPCECDSLIDLSQVFYCPQELRDGINMNKITEEVYAIDPTTSPVIELQCSVLRKLELARGRIYFRGGYMGRGKWVSFPETLYESFKMVSSFIKNSFLSKECKYNAYLSKSSQSYFSDGGNLAQF